MVEEVECVNSVERAMRWGLAVIFAGYLLFAHGCHGNQDNELFAREWFRTPAATSLQWSETMPPLAGDTP